MPCGLLRTGLGPLGSHIRLVLKFIGELIELVEVDSGPEPKRMRDSLRPLMLKSLRLLAETGAERLIYHVLERHPEFLGAPFQDAGQVVVNGQCSAHR
jgi:hypothetical protein